MATRTWLTLHLLRFPEPLQVDDVDLKVGPDHAMAWLYGDESPIGENGLRTHVTPLWAALGFWRDRGDADAILNEPNAFLPDLSRTVESWHALLQPIAHRGETNWIDRLSPGLAIEPESIDPGGPLIVLTSAGYNSGQDIDPERLKDFTRGIERVKDAAKAMPGNLVGHSFGNPAREHDGFTVTLWRNDDTMTDFAYQPGVHKTLLAEHWAVPKFDRSSFTRTRALRATGIWEGDDPLRLVTPQPEKLSDAN